MKRVYASLALSVAASPALAASGPFFSLHNTNFIVTLAFLAFIGVLFYFKVPTTILKMLDARADGIQSELNEARKLRDEAQALLASYERKQKEAQEEAERIVARAKGEAEAAAEQAKADIAHTVSRRLDMAQERLDSATKSAEDEVRHAAVDAAVHAARQVIAQGTTAASANKLIDASIDDLADKLH